MSKFNCSNCKNELIFSMQRPFYAQCGHIFCEQCFSKFYNPINKSISCPIHKKEFLFEFNKFLNYFDTLNNYSKYTLIERLSEESKIYFLENYSINDFDRLQILRGMEKYYNDIF